MIAYMMTCLTMTYHHLSRRCNGYVSTGTPHYVLNTPLFQHTAITREEGEAPFHIIALGAGQDRQHSRQVFLNSRALEGPLLSDYDISPGGMLQFELEVPEQQGGGEGGEGGQGVKVFRPEDLVIREPPAAAAGENYHAEVEKQKEEIGQLRKRLEDTEHLIELQHQLHEHHASEPVVQHHISDAGALVVSGTSTGGSSEGCGRSSTVYIGLVVLCGNLAVVCWMLVLQLQRYKSSGSGLEDDGAAGLLCICCAGVSRPIFYGLLQEPTTMFVSDCAAASLSSLCFSRKGWYLWWEFAPFRALCRTPARRRRIRCRPMQAHAEWLLLNSSLAPCVVFPVLIIFD